MKTIKIKKIPTKFRGSGYKTGQQLPNYSMYKGEYPGEGSQKPVENPDSNNVKDLKIRDSEPKVDKKDATIEAEKGEVKIGKDLQTLRKIGGKKHSQGGTPLAPDPGDFIVSNTIEFNPQIAEALGLDTDVKDGTSWAKYLKKKVDPKTFNTYASLLDNKAKGRDNDPYFEKDAVIQLPDFQMIASKVALANELTKAVDGKDFDIPQVAQLAIQEVSQNPPQKNRNPNLETQAQTMQGFSKSASRTLKMKNGGTVPKYPNGGTIDSVSTWFPNYPGTPKKDRNNSLIWRTEYDPLDWRTTNYWTSTPASTQAALPSAAVAPRTTSGRTIKSTGSVARSVTPTAAPVLVAPHFDWDGAAYTAGMDSMAERIGRPTSIPGSAPTSTSGQTTTSNQQYTHSVSPAGFSMFDQLNVLQALGNKSNDYYPWSAKVNPKYETANIQDANYNPLLASQRTRGELLNQISDPSTARYNMTYQPELINGFLQETQRNDQMNRQEQGRVNATNNQIYNSAQAQNAQIDTNLYDKNTQVRVNRDAENKLRENDIMHVINNAVSNRDKATMLKIMYPQFSYDDVMGTPIFMGGLPNGAASPTQGQQPLTDQMRNFQYYMQLSPEGREAYERINKIDTTRRTIRTTE